MSYDPNALLAELPMPSGAGARMRATAIKMPHRFFYAQRRTRMLGQLAVDAFMVGWVVLWWYLGRATERTVGAIANPARSPPGTPP